MTETERAATKFVPGYTPMSMRSVIQDIMNVTVEYPDPATITGLTAYFGPRAQIVTPDLLQVLIVPFNYIAVYGKRWQGTTDSPRKRLDYISSILLQENGKVLDLNTREEWFLDDQASINGQPLILFLS